MIIAFFIWEGWFAPYPMAPPALFKKAKRTMAVILLITFLSGGNYFVLLLFWPTQVYNVYGEVPLSSIYLYLQLLKATIPLVLESALCPLDSVSLVAQSSALCSFPSPKAASKPL
jgi:hypothetical protein